MNRRRRVLAAAAVAVVAAVGTTAGLLATAGGTPALQRLDSRPVSFQVVYRVTSTATGNTVTTWEVLTVHRPFDSSDLVYPSDPSATTQPPNSGTWFDIDGLYTLDGTGTIRKVAGRQPGPSGSDQALGVELDALAARHLARATGQVRTIAGRRCTVVRFREPPVGPIRPLAGADHDDLCVDADGLVLAERWLLRGRVAYTRTAARVTVGAVADPVTTSGARPLPNATAAPDARPGADPDAPIAPPPTPAGYRLARTDEFSLPTPNGDGLVARSTVWAFTAGAQVITVEAGTEAGGHYPWDGDSTVTARVSLRGLGAATTALRSDGPEVRVALGNGRWVRVRGTVPVDVLVRYAQQLRRRQ